MEKEYLCNCKTGCQNYQCTCLKNNEPCGEQCGCTHCQNPLNGIGLAGLSICTIQNIPAYKRLSAQQLDALLELVG